jgi:Tol biopolymer transport system component
MVAGDTNATSDIFLRDRVNGTTERVSVATGGTEGNALSFAEIISADGSTIVFTSFASNLVAGDSNGFKDVFVHDRVAATTERVSLTNLGAQSDGPSDTKGISADGRFITFSSSATNLVAGDTNGSADIFVRDRLLGTTERVSVSTGGAQANASSGLGFFENDTAGISADGRFVAYDSDATNLVPGDTNGLRDIFVRDRLTGSTERLSVTTAGGEGDAASEAPGISPDGRFVAFSSVATNLVAGDTNAGEDVFERGVDGSDNPNDVTGDGDLLDVVLESMDATTAAVVTRCPADVVSVAAAGAAFLRPEAAGTTPSLAGCPTGPLVGGNPDLNANGASTDNVVHVAPAGGAVLNLGVAATDVSLSGVCTGGNTPGQMCAADGDCAGGTCGASWVAALVSEAGQGAILNGDGDMDDTVAQVQAISGGGWANSNEAADSVQVCGAVVVFITPESAQGADRNGDGDQDDRVLQLFNPASSTLINVGQAAEEFVCGPDLLAFRTREADQDASDLNDDGDSDDFVLQAYEYTRAACVAGSPPGDCLHNSQESIRICQLDACDPRLPYRVLPDLVRFLSYECDQGGAVTNGCAAGGTDLTGDIPPFAGNLVLQVFQLSTGTRRVIGKVNGTVTADGGTRGSGNPLGSGGSGNGDETAAGGVVYNSVGRCLEVLSFGCAVNADCEAGAFCDAGICQREQRVCVNDSDCTGVVCDRSVTAAIVPASADSDVDGVPDHIDNCPFVPNSEQADFDGDEVGDVCDLTTLVTHDSVVLPIKPLLLKIGDGDVATTKSVKVKVYNADIVADAETPGHTVQLAAGDGDCPPGTVVGLPDFNKKLPGAQDSILLAGGKGAKAVVTLNIAAAGFTRFNSTAGQRCTIQLSVSSPGSGDPAPSNNLWPLELNVIDANDDEQGALHENYVRSLKPLKVVIGAGKVGTGKTVKPIAGNADLLPAPDSDSIVITASDGSCPAGTMGDADFDKELPGDQNAATVLGGKTAKGKLPVTAAAAGFSTTSKKSPSRCVALITATGPGGDTDPTNNVTRLVIDVYDKNDL